MKYGRIFGLMSWVCVSLVAVGCGDDTDYSQTDVGTATSSNSTSNTSVDGGTNDTTEDTTITQVDTDNGEPDAEPDAAPDAAPDATGTDTGVPTEGHINTSCGDPQQGLTPVDCTVFGDSDAQCIFSNHCACSEGFVCETSDGFTDTECLPGSICVFQEPEGSRPDNCGATDQGLEPVDCTASGDEGAFCVFSNHCFCSEGFVCDNSDGFDDSECAPGSICVVERPEGSEADSCGAPEQGLTPIDCTVFGDSDAQCVFSNHCSCSENFACETPSGIADGECAPGSACLFLGPEGSRSDSCGSSLQDLVPVDCTASGDEGAYCVFSNHCACSEGFVCENSDGFTDTECLPGSICVLESPVGSTADSCGGPEQGLEPIDCTASGDNGAQCVFSNHCLCSEGFVCDNSDGFTDTECAPGSACIVQEPGGSDADSCGAPEQGLEPVDCTAFGDEGAQCVFSNHCLCSEGFVCDNSDGFTDTECAPGSACVVQDP